MSNTNWHNLVGATLKSLLEPVGIEVRVEVPVTSSSPRADLILIRRQEGGWTEAQRLLLSDGLWDLEVDHILVELKITESLNEETLTRLSTYDTLFLESAGLHRQQLQSLLIAAISPRPEFLDRFVFLPVGPRGVYVSQPLWGGTIRLILLNELADEKRNAPLKCFSSRREERKKAFQTIKQTGLFRISAAFGQTVVGLWRLLMQSSLNSPEMEGVTPEQVALLGREWLDFLVDIMPEEELFAIPKLEHLLVQGRQEGLQIGERKGRQEGLQQGIQEGEANMLLRQLQRRFGSVPDWARERIARADSASLEIWGERVLEPHSLKEVFGD
ncbi:MAG: DUF4351 domain-containing protein [Magnetococcales bacterium]|nr:DUF4351 domain-containing protein [Magnetococcales bacterium]